MSEIILSLEDSKQIIDQARVVLESEKVVNHHKLLLEYAETKALLAKTQQDLILTNASNKYGFDRDKDRAQTTPEGLVVIIKSDHIENPVETVSSDLAEAGNKEEVKQWAL